jgi:FkbM family methyltransferase
MSTRLLPRLVRSARRRRSEFFRKYLTRIGKLRISHATSLWGYDLFDDLDKLESPQTFETIFDVGANAGQSLRLFLRHFPGAVVHAFEPVESTFDSLQKSFCSEPRARLYALAAADVSGAATIRKFAASGLSTMVDGLNDGLREGQVGEETIETCRLDQMMAKLGVKKIDLLKIDVEGFEKNVLLGCGEYLRPDVIRYIFFECHTVTELGGGGPPHTQLCEINSLLTTRGYRFVTLYTEAIAVREPIGSYNALYGPLQLRLTRPGPPLIG